MTDLARRRLGRTGLEVTTLGFGAMELRGVPAGGPEVVDEQAERIHLDPCERGAKALQGWQRGYDSCHLSARPDHRISQKLIDDRVMFC